jgi:isopentenyl phosphate kinase
MSDTQPPYEPPRCCLPASTGPLIFAKLGGSLITDKRHRSTPELTTLRRLARELREVLDGADPPDRQSISTPRAGAAPLPFRLILGHGSGSFGHWEASKFGTRHGVHTEEEWHGFARVSAAALQLNRLVTESFIEAGVPVLSLQPAASAVADHGTLQHLDLNPIRRALAHNLVPLVFGDVAFDTTLGATILSTEDIFVYLAKILKPTWILLFGNAPGVLTSDPADPGRSQTIPTITPDTYPSMQRALGASGYTDVTGGMADKVERMIGLIRALPDLRVQILSGSRPGNFRDTLQDPAGHTSGTLICARSCAPSGRT